MSGAATEPALACGHPASSVVPGAEARRHTEGVTMHCAECARDQLMRQVEQGLAYQHAFSMINGFCLALPDLGADHYHLGSLPLNKDEREMVEEAVEYLQWRGLIHRHEKNPDWICILDESEAKR